jgi:hypothetical protein
MNMLFPSRVHMLRPHNYADESTHSLSHAWRVLVCIPWFDKPVITDIDDDTDYR